MFNMNLSDRLKAAVNTLEATGSSLQARAIGQGQGHDPASLGATSISRQSSPSASTSTSTARDRPISPRVATSPALLSPTGKDGGETSTSTSTSPTKTAGNYIASTGMLAENALSGLRKSFHFTRERPSLDGNRPNLSPTAGPGAVVGANTGPQELKDLPTSPAAGPSSRPSSPGRFLSSNFSLGSDPNSSSGTPQLRSPRPGSKGLNASGSPRPRSPARAALPPPDPSDPATFPLPPSPSLGASTPLAAPTPKYADPLGASPLLNPETAPQEPPTLGLQEATPTEEKGIGLGIGMHGDTNAEGDRVSGESTRENGDPPEAVDESQLGTAELQQRYDDLSKKHSKLVRQVEGVNKVLRELTPLEGGTEDAEALEGWVRMMNGKVTMITEEMKRLQDKINLQESRIEELRDTHRLEGTSQTDLIAKLRTQLSTAESNLASKASELLTLGQLRSDLTKAQTTAKEEEEKRTKAISLLKTVRMKLVKAEKDKEEAEKDRAEERAERSRAGEEVERVKAEREREVNALRKGFERELASARERYEKDLQTKKAAWELEMITTKAAHAKELSNKATMVNGLEAIVQELSNTKNEQFELLQSRQAEVESSRAELETLRNRTKELEFQLREADERCAMLEEGAAVSSRPAEANDRGRSLLGVGLPDGGNLSRSPSRSGSYSQTSAGEVQRLLAEAESRSEAKLSDLRFKIRSLEKERNEAEEEWAVKLQERVHELEKLRRVIAEKEGEYAESLRKRDEKDARIAEGNEARKVLEKEIKGLKAKIEEMKEDVEVAADGERLVKDELSTLRLQLSTIQTQLEESRTQYASQRSANKTLRDELRKVQHSVQLMERQRNPGVGYWSANPAASNSGINVANPTASANGGRSGEGTPTPIKERTEGEARRSMESVATAKDSVAGSDKKQDEEEVNLEYLRNVILQFLENKEMRPNLVRVLSVILRFTPQELRRLNAKLLS